MQEPCDLTHALGYLKDQISGVEEAIERAAACHCRADVDLGLALTAMLRAYQFASESEWRLTNMLETDNDGIFRFDMRGVVDAESPADEQVAMIFACARMAWCNDTTAMAYGYSKRQDLYGKWLWELLPPELPENQQCILQCVQNHYRVLDIPCTKTMADGSTRKSLCRFMGRIEDGRLVNMWGTLLRPAEPSDMPFLVGQLERISTSRLLPHTLKLELEILIGQFRMIAEGEAHQTH